MDPQTWLKDDEKSMFLKAPEEPVEGGEGEGEGGEERLQGEEGQGGEEQVQVSHDHHEHSLLQYTNSPLYSEERGRGKMCTVDVFKKLPTYSFEDLI